MLKELTQAFGVSGMENEIRDVIMTHILSHCDSTNVDSIGNLIAYKKGSKGGKTVMLAAHMDEVGFIITSITDDGYLKFKSIGGIDPQILISQRIIINGIPGIIALKAVHLTTKKEREEVPKISDLFIDIGAIDKADAQKHVTVGDYVMFDSDYVEFGNNMVKAKALDDRAGCTILIEMLKESYPFDLYCCFTVQEEVGLRGAKIAANAVKPDYALVVEATTCNDLKDVPEHETVTKLGGGAAISILDSASFANKEIVSIMEDSAIQNNIPYQFKASTKGGNDAGAIHLASGGIKTSSISIPCRYIHSPVSVMSMNDYYSCRDIVSTFLQRMGDY